DPSQPLSPVRRSIQRLQAEPALHLAHPAVLLDPPRARSREHPGAGRQDRKALDGAAHAPAGRAESSLGNLANGVPAVAALQGPDGRLPGRGRRGRAAGRRTKDERQPVKHAAILDLRVTHSFYADGRCPDLAIAASDDTARLLRNHRCVLGSSPSGIRIHTALDAVTDQAFLPLPPHAVLRFHLELQNADFGLFTDLAAVTALSSPLFTNAAPPAGDPGELTLVQGASAPPPGIFADVEIHLDGWGFGGAAPAFLVAFEARQWRWAYYCVTDLAPN